MKISELKYASLLSYSPHGNTPDDLESKYVTYSLKQDRYEGQPPILMSDWVAKKTQEKSGLFGTFFRSNTLLVPVPSSSLMEKDTLWVPERIANALVKKGFGKQVVPCLRRETAVQKAATSPAHDRPSVKDHYDSFSVQGSLSEPEDILLIDDVITRGATLLGCANRLISVFPKCRIHAFAAIRTISDPEKFKNLQDSCIGTIYLNNNGGPIRYP
jgi:predicted amidophosphoribosyltransferase